MENHQSVIVLKDRENDETRVKTLKTYAGFLCLADVNVQTLRSRDFQEQKIIVEPRCQKAEGCGDDPFCRQSGVT